MRFDHRPIAEVTDEEIGGLIGQEEDDWTEFTRDPYPQTNGGKMEMLKEVAGMANLHGGYILVGVDADDDERALGFKDVPNAPPIAQRMLESCHANITEPIGGLEIKPRLAPSGETVVIVHVPESFRKPHMITFSARTRFTVRSGTKPRPMTVEEIRLAFQGDELARTIRSIHSGVEVLLRSPPAGLPAGEMFSLGEGATQDVRVLLDTSDQAFQDRTAGGRWFRMTATPVVLRDGLVDNNDREIIALVQDPPGQRYGGWNVKPPGNVRPTLNGLENDRPGFRHLIVLTNGHVEFWTPLDDESFTWRQRETHPWLDPTQHPRLYPYAVCEYPVSFLRFVDALYRRTSIRCRVIIRLWYAGVAGSVLLPGHPRSFFWSEVAEPDEVDQYTYHGADPLKVERNTEFPFRADQLACDLVAKVYNAFRLLADQVPFFDKDGNFAP